MALTITTTDIANELVQHEGQYKTKIVSLNVTGDASDITEAMPTTWWLKHGLATLRHVIAMEPLTAATPDEDEYHLFKFSADFGTLYVADSHAGAVMSATAMTAKIKLIGT